MLLTGSFKNSLQGSDIDCNLQQHNVWVVSTSGVTTFEQCIGNNSNTVVFLCNLIQIRHE